MGKESAKQTMDEDPCNVGHRGDDRRNVEELVVNVDKSGDEDLEANADGLEGHLNTLNLSNLSYQFLMS